MLDKTIEKLFASALAIEDQAALEREDVGFMARAMTLCTMPHSKQSDNEFTRKNGNFTMTMLSPRAVGLPYGVIPRLLLCWLTSEAVRTKSRTIILGDSLSEFMKKLGMQSQSGGKTGSITRLKDQLKRLFFCDISCNYQSKGHDAGMGFKIADAYSVWWTVKESEQGTLWQSTVTLSENFFNEVTTSPVPLDLMALKALKRSPLAIDIYLWLTYRMSYLKAPCQISWHYLQKQFGSEYARDRDFKTAFKDAIKKIQVVYAGANFQLQDAGVLLKPGHPSIPKKQLKSLSKTEVIHA